MIAVIAARAGSKRLVKKNTKLLNDVPLYEYTLQAAVLSGVFEKIIFTTDDNEILKALELDNRCEVHHRSPELANGQATMMQVLDHLGRSQNWDNNTSICLLAPVNPLRSSHIIRECYSKYQDSNLSSLATVNRARIPGQFLMRLSSEQKIIRKQQGSIRPGEVDSEYEPNGAVIMIDWEVLKDGGSFYPPECHGFILQWPYCLDIDTQEDYDQVAFILGQRTLQDLELDV